MNVRYAKSVWGFDDRWIRVEAVDEYGRALGFVSFEPNRGDSSAPRIACESPENKKRRSFAGFGLSRLQPAMVMLRAFAAICLG